jgi:hypothetical protein
MGRKRKYVDEQGNPIPCKTEGCGKAARTLGFCPRCYLIDARNKKTDKTSRKAAVARILSGEIMQRDS